jgi:hypothetical protein
MSAQYSRSDVAATFEAFFGIPVPVSRDIPARVRNVLICKYPHLRALEGSHRAFAFNALRLSASQLLDAEDYLGLSRVAAGGPFDA